MAMISNLTYAALYINGNLERVGLVIDSMVAKQSLWGGWKVELQGPTLTVDAELQSFNK